MTGKVHVSHNGMESTLQLARQNIFWPGMSSEIKERVRGCSICAKYHASQQKPPMQSHDIPQYPFQLVSMDVFFTRYKGKQRKFLVTADHYSDYFELDILNDMSASSIINCCKRNFSRFGIPQIVCSDNGTNFVNQAMKELAATWDFMHVTSSPYHQKGNGKAEATVKIAKRLIQKAEDDNQDLWYSLLHWRNIPNKMKSSPSERLLSRSTRIGIPASLSKLKPHVIKDVPDKIVENRRRNKRYYDRNSKILPELEIGTPVIVQINPETSKQWTKGVIEQRVKDRSYVVNVDGALYRRNIVNIKPHLSSVNEEDKPELPNKVSGREKVQTFPKSIKDHVDSSLPTNTEVLTQRLSPDYQTAPPSEESYLQAIVAPEVQYEHSPKTARTKDEKSATPRYKKSRSAEQSSPTDMPQTRDEVQSRPKREIRLPARLMDFEVSKK